MGSQRARSPHSFLTAWFRLYSTRVSVGFTLLSLLTSGIISVLLIWKVKRLRKWSVNHTISYCFTAQRPLDSKNRTLHLTYAKHMLYHWATAWPSHIFQTKKPVFQENGMEEESLSPPNPRRRKTFSKNKQINSDIWKSLLAMQVLPRERRRQLMIRKKLGTRLFPKKRGNSLSKRKHSAAVALRKL